MTAASDAADQRLSCGSLSLVPATRLLTTATQSFHLTPKECRLLAAFLANEGQVLTRQYLMKVVWDTDYIADTRTLEVHVHWLRRKLETDQPRSASIHTVRGVGYVLRRLGPGGRPWPRRLDEGAASAAAGEP
jgi:DNA-binding response OmpR family regulator